MYEILAAYFVGASLVAFVNLRWSLTLFLLGYVGLPFATALGPLVYSHGLFAFDLYFPLAGLALAVTGRKIYFPTPLFGILFGVLMLFLFASAVAKLSSPGEIPKAFYLDLRVPVVIIETVVLYSMFQKARIEFDSITRLAFIAAMAAIAYWLLNYRGLFTRGDVYYDVANRYRFWSTGSTVGMLYVLYWFVGARKGQTMSVFQNWTAALCVIATLASGERAPIAFLAASALIFTPHLGRKLAAVILIAGAAMVFVYVGATLGIDRINSATSAGGVVQQLMVRFGPTFPYLARMKGELLYGFGFGTTFNIPWFSYRGLDTDNSTVDSMYLTYFVKFGLMSLLIVYLLVAGFTARLPKRFAWAIAAFFLTQAVFYVMPAHPHYLAYPIMGALVALPNARRRHAAPSLRELPIAPDEIQTFA